MGKRANGEGSVYLRTDGRWCASVTAEGGRRQHFLGRTRAEVARKLTVALDARDKGMLATGPRQTVGQFFITWLDAVRLSLRPRTFVRYEQLVRLHVLPDLGPLSLTKLGPQQLQRLYASRLDADLSSTTVNHLHALIHRALANALRWGLVHRNVADLVDPPRNRHFEIATLAPEQARAFLAAAAGNRLEALYVLALTTGMRQGEILGLRWRHVDLDGGSLQVRGSLQRVSGKLTVTATKTERSQRQVSLTFSAVSALRWHRVLQAQERLHLGAAWQADDLVFTNEIGAAIGASRLLRASFHPLLLRAGLPPMRFHDLRHSAATLLLGQGTHPKIVAELLGHSKIGTTMDLYSHVTPTMQHEATLAMEAILRR